MKLHWWWEARVVVFFVYNSNNISASWVPNKTTPYPPEQLLFAQYITTDSCKVVLSYWQEAADMYQTSLHAKGLSIHDQCDIYVEENCIANPHLLWYDKRVIHILRTIVGVGRNHCWPFVGMAIHWCVTKVPEQLLVSGCLVAIAISI